MKNSLNLLGALLLLLTSSVSCTKDPSQVRHSGARVNNLSIFLVSKDTCTHGRQYYLNFDVDSIHIVCNTNLWATSYESFDIQMNGNFPNGYIYLVAFTPTVNYEYPIGYWNSILLNFNGEVYYAGREYDEIIGNGIITVSDITDECVKGFFECETGISQYYYSSSIKKIKNGVFHLKKY